jgi:hypothetical protein
MPSEQLRSQRTLPNCSGNKSDGRKRWGTRSYFTVSTGSPLDMNVERSRRLAPVLETLELAKAGYHAFRHFNVSMMDALSVPLKTIQERIGHALTGSFTLDVYGQTLDWKVNEHTAKGLANEIAKAVTAVESNLDSGHLIAYQKENFQIRDLEVFENQLVIGCGGWI